MWFYYIYFMIHENLFKALMLCDMAFNDEKVKAVFVTLFQFNCCIFSHILFLTFETHSFNVLEFGLRYLDSLDH